MTKATGPSIVIAKNGFWVMSSTQNQYVRAGDAWAADDPIVKGSPTQFETLRVHSSKSKTGYLEFEPEAAATA